MHYAKAVSPLVTALTVVAIATEAIATPEDDDLKEARRSHRPAEILIHMDTPRSDSKSWIENHMVLRKRPGIAYRYKYTNDDNEKRVITVGGPLIRKGAFGMMFEYRF